MNNKNGTFSELYTRNNGNASLIKKGFKLKGVMFDLDGTIVDSTEAYAYCARKAFTAFNFENVGQSKILEIPRRLEQNLPLDDILKVNVDEFLKIYLKTYYEVTKAKTKPFPNVTHTLDILSRHAKLALVTMRFVPKEQVIDELRQFGLSRYFAHVVTALDTSKPKPSPEALVRCLRALDVQMCDCLMVGDSISDVRAGKAAGIGTVAVLSGLFSCQELTSENPDFILNDITELPGILF
jgi:HAD superfamily hydrolase (TIGR01509 family)